MEFLVLLLVVMNLALSGVLYLRIRKSPTYQDGGIDTENLIAEISQENRRQLAELKGDLQLQRTELRDLNDRSQQNLEMQFRHFNEAQNKQAHFNRQENATVRQENQEQLAKFFTDVSTNISSLAEGLTKKQSELQDRVATQLDKLRSGNEEKLEQMRQTVDEKLQGTLEKRLGESFKLVSDRLEQVQKGLGEMQNLASDVGGLKRVLTNVKTRGTWGEVQLARQLQDLLTPDQYDVNVKILKTSSQEVEFAVKLPGREEGEHIYLPIDSKFPQEDYERLLVAQEQGDASVIEQVGKQLEREVKAQAKLISDKYIHPPFSTDFAIMYLPTEGLFAEIIRRPGLASEIQNTYRVMITGPTTLMSLLNSLQMGFKTLAIEKSTSQVWKVLSAAKAEFEKYAQVWEKLEKQLTTAQNTVSEAGRRTRAINRKLTDVESVESLSGSEKIEEFLEIGEGSFPE